jgi:hypothetical protein
MTLWKTSIVDFLAWFMPTTSAVLAVGAGALALMKWNDCAAILAIIAGLTSAVGVTATGRASQIRDDKLRFWIEAAGDDHARVREGFGS